MGFERRICVLGSLKQYREPGIDMLTTYLTKKLQMK